MLTSSIRLIGANSLRRPQVLTKPSLTLSSAVLSYKDTFFSRNQNAFNTMFSNRNLVTISSSIVDGLKKHGVIPEVLEPFTPLGLLTISYGNNIDVVLGNELKVKDTQKIPTVQFTLNEDNDSKPAVASSFSSSDYYTLVVTDPDAPSKTDKKWSEYCHYIKTNILLVDSEGAKNNAPFLSSVLDLSPSSSDYMPYVGPAPPEKTGKHRYVVVLLKQKNGEFSENVPKLSNRANWGYGKPSYGLKKWASQYNMEPVAANFFYAKNEIQ